MECFDKLLAGYNQALENNHIEKIYFVAKVEPERDEEKIRLIESFFVNKKGYKFQTDFIFSGNKLPPETKFTLEYVKRYRSAGQQIYLVVSPRLKVIWISNRKYYTLRCLRGIDIDRQYLNVLTNIDSLIATVFHLFKK